MIGRTLAESVPAWPERPAPPASAPNIVVWLLDDAGFAHLEPYGGPVPTPTVQRVADAGLVYTNFHSVPICSPARAALLTGRNHHSVAMGSHIMSPAGFPGYHGRVPPSAASFARVLREAGYATYAVGKWDQTPATEASAAGPFDTWPLRQGFERFYGFVGAEAHHFLPSLWSDHSPVSPRGDSYFLTTDLADRAMEFIGGLRANDPARPFLLYWATGAVHAPHHAPADAIARFRGAYDAGWDALRERTLERQHDLGLLPEGTVLAGKQGGVADWDDLAGAEQRLYARQMEAFAGQLAHADREFGRILELIDRLGERDNTLVVVTSDNGASAEGGMAGLHNEAVMFNGRRLSFEENAAFEDRWGGPETVNHFHAGWAAAGNTPFPYYKHHVDGGGTHVPLVLSWPDGIDARGVRSQYHHIIDLAPTLLAASGVPLPDTVDGVTQQPFDGIDMAYTFATAGTPSRRTVQYYEIWGNRGIYRDGWKAATIHNQIMPWQTPVPGDPAADVWRLYHVAEDFSESRDVAAEHPDKLRELQDLWEAEAQRYGVFPLDPDRRARFIAQMNRFGRREPVVRYLPVGARRIPEALSPPVKNRSFRITAHLDSPAGARAEGVIVAAGGITGGYALFIDDGVPVYVHNLYNEEHHYVRGTRSLPKGSVSLEFRFDRHDAGNGGVGTLLLDGAPVGTAEIPATVPNAFSIEDGFDIALDDGSAVAPDYAVPFPFNGTVREVLFNMTPAEAETPP